MTILGGSYELRDHMSPLYGKEDVVCMGMTRFSRVSQRSQCPCESGYRIRVPPPGSLTANQPCHLDSFRRTGADPAKGPSTTQMSLSYRSACGSWQAGEISHCGTMNM